MARIGANTVKALKPGGIAWDSELRGFGVRCQVRHKIYFIKTRARGRQIWLTIGDSTVYTPQQARTAAARYVRELRAGAAPEKLRPGATDEPLVNELADRYEREHIDVHLKASTRATFRRLLKAHVRPAIGKRLVADVTSADMAKLHHKLRETPRQANQTMAVASKMFSLAELWQLRPQASNPCKGIQKYGETERSRFYDDAELQAIGKAIAALEAENAILPGAAACIRLAPMTGLRLGELLDLKWPDVNLDRGFIEIRDAKAGARRHPIGAAAVAYLSALERAGEWVCRGVAPDRRLSTRLLQQHWEAVRAMAGLRDARFHDLRHSYGTFAGATGANAFLVRDAMGHKTLAMTGRYVGQEADPLRALADKVSGRVAAALTGGNAEVHALPKGRRTKR